MLDFADVVAINKFERRGAEDARRDVGRQLVRNREAFGATREDMPVFGTFAARFNDDGVTALYQHLRGLLAERRAGRRRGRLPHADAQDLGAARRRDPARQVRYLAEIAETVRGYHAATDDRPSTAARVRQHLRTAARAASARRSTRPLADADDGAARRRRRAARRLGADRRGLRRRRARRARPGQGAAHRAHPRDAVGQPDPPRRAAPLHRGRRAAALPARREPARPLPVHRRACSRSSARARTRPGCSPARATPFRTNRRFQLLSAGCRRQAAVDRVRLGHALRPRPRRRAPTSTARSAPPASRSPRSTT